MAAEPRQPQTSHPPAERIQEWAERLSHSRSEVEEARVKAADVYASFCTEVRAAFADGLSAPQISEITGMTGSRLYQVKAGRRT